MGDTHGSNSIVNTIHRHPPSVAFHGAPVTTCVSKWDRVLGWGIDVAIIGSVVGGPIIGYRKAKVKGALVGAAAGVGIAVPLLIVSLARAFNGKYVIRTADCDE